MHHCLYFYPLMKSKLFRLSYPTWLHAENLFFASVLVLAAGLPTSNSLMSWGQFGMAAAWLWDTNWKNKLSRLKEHLPLLLFASIYLIYLFGMIHTSDWQEGLRQLRIKLPILIIPIMATSFPILPSSRWNQLLHVLLGAILLTAIYGLFKHTGLIDNPNFEFRKLSPFISNIRFATLLVFGIFTCLYLFSKEGSSYRILPNTLYLILAIMFVTYLLLLKSLTGIYILFFTGITTGFVLSIKKSNKYFSYSLLFMCILIVWGGVRIWKFEYDRYHIKEKIDFSHLPPSTPKGSIYKHDTLSQITENGYYVWLYISYHELRKTWNERSQIPFDGITQKGYPIKETLIHFLSSKGLKKDEEGVKKLTNSEIKAIESGINNVIFMNKYSIGSRIYEIIRELDHYRITGDATGKSSALRLELWRHAWMKIKQQPLIGYGTGDLTNELTHAYIRTQTPLHPAYWYHPHNQYLSTALSTGIPSVFLLILLIINPLFLKRKIIIPLFWLSVLIVLLAMIDEDTLTTQAGATQVAFLYVFMYLSPGLLQNHES